MDVEEGHEDPDDEAPPCVAFVAHGVAQAIWLPLDVDDRVVRRELCLIQDDPVRRREEKRSVRVGRPRGVSEEVVLREPGHGLVPQWPDLRLDPFFEGHGHSASGFPGRCGTMPTWPHRVHSRNWAKA